MTAFSRRLQHHYTGLTGEGSVCVCGGGGGGGGGGPGGAHFNEAPLSQTKYSTYSLYPCVKGGGPVWAGGITKWWGENSPISETSTVKV